MTIHHDKLAYGKLAPQSEELPEEKLLEMLARLEEYDEENGAETEKAEKSVSEKRP